jgi:ketosteroid isomerase-like protein
MTTIPLGATERATADAVARFGAAFDAHDVDAVMAAMTEDCVFENTAPPDGVRYAGQADVRAAFVAFFEASADAVFETESEAYFEDQAVVCWRYDWGAGHVRGVDLFVVRDGLVAEKRSYVKG